MKSTVLQNCNKCGLCLSVCPTYKVLNQEHASPRARLQLINFYKDKKVLSSIGLKEIISKCLMCGSCAAICPSGINHYSQFMEMRTKMRHDHGEKVAIKSLIFLLAKEYRIRLAAGFAEFSQRIIPDNFIEKYNLGNIPVKKFPKLNKKPLRKAVPEIISPEKSKKGTVLYFTGCATNYAFDGTGFATIKILKQMGSEVIIPEKQTCCGIPMLFHGARDQAEKNILINIECLSQDDVKAIIVDCPTCGSALKNEYPALQKQLNLDDTAVQKISSKVIDIMSFILQESDHTDLFETSVKMKVTYHLPCHLKNGLKSSYNTEKILREHPGLEYIQAEDVDECCGGGGTFFYEYPEISKQMVATKLKNARSTGAEVWLTDCPVCRINLSGNLKEKDNMIVKHPVEML
ncbi:MAG: (Fe-S)-binding protein [Desulfobacteraceae bacterium]|nr:(Fe-S)-binding protein [Desulfobacteraceae bacterium]